MSPNKFELTDINDDNNTNNHTSFIPGEGKRNGGFYLSGPVALILVLLAAVVAVGVGIIVHFAGGRRDVVCNCPSSVTKEKTSVEAIRQECEKLASDGDTGVCLKCPAASTPPPGTTPSGPATTPGPTETPKVTDVRLPTSVYPLHYDVELQPYMHHANPADFTFRGFVRILVECRQATNNVTLHINVLKVQDSSIVFRSETPGSSETWSVVTAEDKDRQFLILKLERDLEVGKKYGVEMNFTSPLKKDLYGLYYSQYTRGNQTIYLATTKFEPTNARKAFPCFDEPAIKATFNITLIRPIDRVSLTNTLPVPGSSTQFQEGGITYVRDVYERTPKMSTYLLAFIVCDYNYTHNYTRAGKLFRAWAAPESVDQTHYSLKVGVEITNYFEEYFRVSYPLKKQDMIAIPDFAAGAMENWGLITYRESSMLFKENVSNENNKEKVAMIVSHELAHQWFGNLVTPSWWDDLWLKEGFASFVEYLGVDHVHPDWKMFDKFVVSKVQNSFESDSLVSSHPVYVPVAHPKEINAIFDTVSYDKGACIIRMMSFFLGIDTFQKGLTNYLNRRSYDSASHDDLWSALSEQATAYRKNLNVKEIMDTWILQMNFPLVTVSRDHNIPNVLQVTQERFLADRSVKDPGNYNSTYGYKWSVPLTFTFGNNPRFNHTFADVYWLNQSETSKSIRLPEAVTSFDNTNDWVLANVQQYGYYRVNYQLGNWQALSRQLKLNHLVISVINRAQIINDAWNLAKSGYVGIEVPLEVIEYLKKEREYIPWYAAEIELNIVEKMLALNPIYGAFKQFMVDTLNETFQEFSLINVRGGHVEVATQSLIASQACFYGIPSCLEQVSRKFKEWMQRPTVNPVNVNLKSVVYCHAIANGGWDEWKFALDRYKDSDAASEKSDLISAMSCSKQAWILNHYMNLILEPDSPIRGQDALTVVSNVARNIVGRDLAWKFLRSKFSVLKERFGASLLDWGVAIFAVTNSFITELEQKEVAAFKESESGHMGLETLVFENAIEKIASNVNWINTNVPVITKWLRDKGYLSQ